MFSKGCQALANIHMFNKTKNNKQKRTYIVTEQRYVRKGDGGDE